MSTVIRTDTESGTITLDRATLINLLDRARYVVPSRFPKPIFTCVHLEASEGLLCLRAADGDVALFTRTPVAGELPACVVPLAELSRRLKASKQATCGIRLTPDGEEFLIGGGRVQHALRTLLVVDFPPVPSAYVGRTVTVDAAELCAGLQVAGLAVAKEATRYAIDGVLLECDDQGTRLVATDAGMCRHVPAVESRDSLPDAERLKPAGANAS